METISKQPEPTIDEENKVKDKELLAKVRQAYKQLKTKDIRAEELGKWLRENGLTQEETEKAINTAIKHSKIRFCYTSKSPDDRGKLVPYYERITKRDILPQEILDEMFKHTYRVDPKATIITRPHTEPSGNREKKPVGYITAYCRNCGKKIKHTITDGTATCLVCYSQFPYRKRQKKIN